MLKEEISQFSLRDIFAQETGRNSSPSYTNNNSYSESAPMQIDLGDDKY
jgi:hypothetical protein